MIYIIDGTGPDNFSDYHADMRRGFCWSLKTQNGPAAEYLRGPTELGLETWEIAELMYSRVKAHPGAPVVLAGHSRGGAAVIYLARKLQKDGIQVSAMVLFDAVRRALQKSPTEYGLQILNAPSPANLVFNAATAAIEVGLDFFQIGQQKADVIPANVERVLHVVRDERFSNYFMQTQEYRELAGAARAGSGKSLTVPQSVRLDRLRQWHRRMRDACRFDCIKAGVSTGFSFDNTGMESEPGCKLQIVPYMATHGAMGGAPLEVRSYISDATYAADIEAQEVVSMLQVQTRVNSFLLEVNASVCAVQPVQGARLAYVPATVQAGQSLTAIRK